MDTSRILELAGIKKSVGIREAAILMEGRAGMQFDSSLPFWNDLIGDSRTRKDAISIRNNLSDNPSQEEKNQAAADLKRLHDDSFGAGEDLGYDDDDALDDEDEDDEDDEDGGNWDAPVTSTPKPAISKSSARKPRRGISKPNSDIRDKLSGFDDAGAMLGGTGESDPSEISKDRARDAAKAAAKSSFKKSSGEVAIPAGWDMPTAPKKGKDLQREKAKSNAANKYKFTNTSGGRSANHQVEAKQFLQDNPEAPLSDFKPVWKDAILRHNPDIPEESMKKAINTGRSVYAKHKAKEKKLAKLRAAGLKGESFAIRQIESGKFLSERSRTLLPDWVEPEDLDTDFLMFKDMNKANIIRESMILHSEEILELVTITENGWD